MPKHTDKVMFLEIEKSKIAREKARLVLDKSIALYVIFMLIGIIGFVFEYIDSVMLNTLIIVGIVILIVGTIPYMIVVRNEERKIESFLRKK